jgi:hypothetical protein
MLTLNDRTIVLFAYFATAIFSYMMSSSVEKLIKKNAQARKRLSNLYQKEKDLYLKLSHELNTALTILKHQKYYHTDKDYKDQINELEKSLNAMKIISTENLAVANLSTESINLNALITEVVREIGPLVAKYKQIGQTDLNLIYKQDRKTKNLKVHSSRIQLKQAILNIIYEYLRLQPSKKKGFEVKIFIEKGLGKYSIIFLSNISSPRKLITPKTKKDANGIRLAKLLVEANNGKFRILNTKNKFSKISIQLPIV